MAHSHGSGEFSTAQFARFGREIAIEPGVLVFHPENIIIDDHVSIGRSTILKGYYRNRMTIARDTAIGAQCFFHSAGGLTIGKNVRIGPAVYIITSYHKEEGIGKPILHSALEFAPVIIEDGCVIEAGAIILPGVTIGRNSIVRAGSLVSRDVSPHATVSGIPARPGEGAV